VAREGVRPCYRPSRESVFNKGTHEEADPSANAAGRLGAAFHGLRSLADSLAYPWLHSGAPSGRRRGDGIDLCAGRGIYVESRVVRSQGWLWRRAKPRVRVGEEGTEAHRHGGTEGEDAAGGEWVMVILQAWRWGGVGLW
jgi:hypothetical protein